MNDSIFDIYTERAKREDDERAAAIQRQREADAQERLRLITALPAELNSMFTRLKETNYADELVKGIIRRVVAIDGSERKVVSWSVGRTDSRYEPHEGQVSNSIFVCSDWTFAQNVGVNPRETLQEVLMEDFSLGEVRSVTEGMKKVGMRKAEWRG